MKTLNDHPPGRGLVNQSPKRRGRGGKRRENGRIEGRKKGRMKDKGKGKEKGRKEENFH